MTKRGLLTFAVVVLLGLSILAVHSGYKQSIFVQRATAAEVPANTTPVREEGKSPSVQEASGKLKSADKQERSIALSVLTSSYDEVSRQIVQDLEQQKDNLDHTYNGRTYTIVVAAGKFRVANAIPFLVENITYQVNKGTMPVGAKFAPGAYYPIANALVEIGDGTVIKSVIEQLSTSKDEKTITVDTWVISQILGKKTASAFLTGSRDNATTDAEKNNIKKALDLMQQGVSLP